MNQTTAETTKFTPPPAYSGLGEIPIIQKLYEFHLELHVCVLSFPKLDKHTLGQHCLAKSLQLIETIFTASRLTAAAKRELLLQANGQLDVLKLLVRICNDTKAINQKKYMLLQSFLQEVGKMLGGWIKSLN